ncbi:hypothetical protein HPB48_015256 [Haemaphysalis longicornis]|uniref:RING-type domain-containing protein n=1 Tax=Haemaphysalis longicornis TaxID=44386 RepID=A0A9J6FIE1_HAELO|nr:hypothetical protein HPB48_015256 [Haemaphysalis longicornis]
MDRYLQDESVEKPASSGGTVPTQQSEPAAGDSQLLSRRTSTSEGCELENTASSSAAGDTSAPTMHQVPATGAPDPEPSRRDSSSDDSDQEDSGKPRRKRPRPPPGATEPEAQPPNTPIAAPSTVDESSPGGSNLSPPQGQRKNLPPTHALCIPSTASERGIHGCSGDSGMQGTIGDHAALGTGMLYDAGVVEAPSSTSSAVSVGAPSDHFGKCSGNTGSASGGLPGAPIAGCSYSSPASQDSQLRHNQPDMTARAGPSSAHQGPARGAAEGRSSGTAQAPPTGRTTGTSRCPSRRLSLLQAEIRRAFAVFARATDIPFSMPRSEIEELPAYRFNPGANDSDEVMCVVCLCHFRAQELVRVLPCSHEFHAECVDKWLESNSRCPVCRAYASGAGPGASS